MKVKTKLLASFGGLVFMMIILFLLTWNALSNQKDDGLVVNLAGRQRMLTQKMTKELLFFVNKRNQTGQADESLKGQVHLTMKVFETTLHALKESGDAPLSITMAGDYRHCPKAEEPAYTQLAKVQDIWDEFSSHVNNILKAPSDDDLDWVMHNNTKLLSEMNKAVVMMQVQSEEKISSLLWMLFVGVGLSMAFAGLAVRIVYGVLNRLKTVSEFAEHMGSGDFSFSFATDENNELGDILREMNQTVETVGSMIGKVKNKTYDLDASSKELGTLSDDLMRSASEMHERANSVAAASEEMSVNMSTVSSAVNQTNSNIEVISGSTTELSSTVTEIAENTERARQVSTQAVHSVAQASEKVSALGNSANEIGAVIEAIVEIAEQTKLLALNATIEAARAGEAGKGFAVVANEVKDLAAQTNNATEDIRIKIEAMQASSQETIHEIQNITEVIDNVNEIVNSIASAVEEQSITTQNIANNIRQTTEATGEMTSNVSQAAEVAGMIASDVADVNNASEMVNQVSVKLVETAHMLTSISTQIGQMLEQFKLA